MDPSAFVAPARIGVLLVPLHPIKRARFQQYADQIRAFDSIELSQVPVDNRGDRAIFSSSPTTTGQLLFEYLTPTTYASAHPLAFLAEFQLHRQVHGIIGIFDASEHTDNSTSLQHALAQFHHALRRLPKTFAVKLFGFHPSEHQLTEAQKHINENDGLVLIPATTQISFFLGTVLADFAGHILREFSNLAAQLESRTSIPTPQETPQLTSPFTFIPTKPNARSTIHSYTAGATRPTAVRSSSLPPNTTPNNSTSTSTNASASSSHLNNSAGAAKGGGIISNETPKIDLTAFGLAAPPQSRTSLGLWGGSSSGNQEGFLYGRSIQSHVNVAPNAAPSPPPGSTLVDSKSRKKVAGRERKLMADMWLLAGRTEQAIACYEEAIALLKLTWSDNVWYASALEGLTIALVLQAWRPPSPAAAVAAAATAKHASTNSISKSTNSISKKTANGTSTPTSTLASNAADPSTFLSSIPDRLGQAVGLYEKMLPNLALANSLETPPPPDPDCCHPLIYAEACLRIARFLLAVHEARGKIERAIEKLIIPSNCSASSALRKGSTFMTSTSAARTKNSEDEAQEARWRSLSPSNPVPRSMIAQWASMAYSAHLGQLALPTRLRVTGEIASFFGRIGYRRKEGFVLRELAALCGQGVAGKGVEVFSAVHGTSPTSPVSATKDGHKVSGGQLLPAMNDRTASIVRTTSDSAGNESIIRIAEKVCESFGIVVVPRIARDTSTPNTASGHHLRQKSLLQGRPLELDYRLSSSTSPFGWSHLQMGVLKDAISVAEALPDYQAAIRFTVTALRAFAETMPAWDQLELSRNIPRIFAAATRRGAAFELEYWGPTQLVMSLEMAPPMAHRLTPNRLPIEHSIKDAEANGTFNNFALAKKDPFIIGGQRSSLNASHDPNDVSSRIRPRLITNEVAEVFVTLQNPFGFDLEIQSMQLSTTGVDFICDALSTIVPAGSFHTVRLSGTPQAPGRLTIRGCHILLAGCTSREFLLPVWNDQEEDKRQKVALLDTARERIKTTGLTAFVTNRQASQGAAEQSTTTTTEQEFRFLECTVVREMPLLCVRSTSLTHGALMLYDGETSTIRIALENVSTRPVDFVKLTFSDLHTTTTQAYVDENELPPAEAYEIEADNRDRPVFSWTVDQVPRIKPGQTYLLDVQCLGKVGCGSGTIQIDYATLPPSEAMTDPTTVFHTRQILCDVFMTVHRALLAHTLDILRLQALPEHVAFAHGRSASVAHLGRRGAALDQRLEQSLRDVDDGEHCLVSIDVMNAYGKPFEVKIERCEDESGFFQVRQRLEPGATLRMLARIDRINIPAEEAERPIPALSERQFVLSKHQVSAAEQRSTRELFWFREELLRRIRATWNEVGSLRTGTISLRSLKLSSSLLDVLKGDEVEVELQLVENEASSPEAFHFKGRGNRLVYAAQPNEFIDVCAYVSNHSPLAVQLALRLDLKPPDATVASSLTHLARHIIIEGVSPVAVRTLLPGESETVKVSICLLAEGRYELGCVVEDVREGAEADKAWTVREPLIVDVA
ncbi:BZ3500_MvSof-1268-A1-R1_Chr9g10432 [Microbotryum saponariae]|uniref:BZ3500_MvSof-1268-A1-R1_Chr9g10432 protein n=1 Tax=Microbotryum saponariae TaxID=289078 RepID=A0A2X0K8S6_9BASI|nr:BZ3501_MvSof-1269-A2-R1_Chr9g10182 [Microbotryum saponariae]SDA00084.1 BZ3500_MvSof-1268-A1-R1_Chr9g10432 [Microbotryum saponariae]